jgi:hypothetical protein
MHIYDAVLKNLSKMLILKPLGAQNDLTYNINHARI